MPPFMLEYASYCKVPPQFMRGVLLILITPHTILPKSVDPATLDDPACMTPVVPAGTPERRKESAVVPLTI
jgi:hypothetical protein